MKTSGLWRRGFVTIGVIALGLAWLGQGAGRVGPSIEYAELVVVGNDAVLWTMGESFYIEGPDVRDAVEAVGKRGVNIVQPARIIHLNTLGAAGWEIVEVGGGGGGESYLLKRYR